MTGALADRLAWELGTNCVSYLRALEFSRRQGPGRTYTAAQHEHALHRMEHLAWVLATAAAHYGRQAQNIHERVRRFQLGQV